MGSAGARTYSAIVSSRWFRRILATMFILAGVAFVLTAIATVALLGGAFFGVADAQIALQEETAGGAIASLIQAIASVVAGVLIIRGLLALRHSRARAYRAFELAILVALLLAQPFAFLDVGFGAALDVFIDLALPTTLRYTTPPTRLNSLFGLSFETVTALRGGHFAHRPCRDLVTAAALRPGT